jgi:hypothetical protein
LQPWPKRTAVSVTVLVTSKETHLPKRTAKLSDPNSVEFPFTFDIGDEAFYKQDKVTIQDGTFEGAYPGAYQISYVALSSDGQIHVIPQRELVKTTRTR